MTAPATSARVPPLDADDLSQLRALGHRMVDDQVDDLTSIRERPVWQPVPGPVRARLSGPVPEDPEGAHAAYEDFRELVAPYPRGNVHPRFWGWVNGSGLPLGMFADLLASGMNASVGAFENAPSLVEEQVLAWLKEMLDVPADAGGLLTSGCSMSNLLGLAVARGVGVRETGLAAAPRLTAYTSSEAHASVRRSFELLGLGSAAVRRIPVDEEFRIDLAALDAAIEADVRSGARPVAVVANAGTVNTGSVDDLDAVADLAAKRHVWLHVDGALGALAWLLPECRDLLSGLQRADSIAFDMHKWGYLPYDVGCLLVRDAEAQLAAFASPAAYLDSTRRWSSPGPPFADLGLETTRRFRALKVWMCLKAYGVSSFRAQISDNLALAGYLADRVRAGGVMSLEAPVRLNVVCFRYAPAGLSPEQADEVNDSILGRLWDSGLAVVSDTRLRGRFVLRAAITNHRTRREDVDVLVDTLERLAREARA